MLLYCARIVTNCFRFILVRPYIEMWCSSPHVGASAQRAFHRNILPNIYREKFPDQMIISFVWKIHTLFIKQKWSLHILKINGVIWWRKYLFDSRIWNVIDWGFAWCYRLLLVYWKCLKSLFCHEFLTISIPWSYDSMVFEELEPLFSVWSRIHMLNDVCQEKLYCENCYGELDISLLR